jgi:hypothetical protein
VLNEHLLGNAVRAPLKACVLGFRAQVLPHPPQSVELVGCLLTVECCASSGGALPGEAEAWLPLTLLGAA